MPFRRPRRIQRTRTRNRATPPGAVYVGRPTIWANPFQRAGIGHARSVILYRAWIAGEVGRHIQLGLHFGEDEITGLARARTYVRDRLHNLAGHDLQCWCPLTSNWCHAEVLLALANPGVRIPAAEDRLTA